MYKDRNPYVHYLRCNLCNEPFDMFSKIILPYKCKSKEEDNIEPHYYHVCCTDIIFQEQELFNGFKKLDNIDCKVDCVVCIIAK